MTISDHSSKPLPGQASVPIPFPPAGKWLEKEQYSDLGPFKEGLCFGNFYKTSKNELYIYLQVWTWGDAFVKAYMPLRVPEAGAGVSILHILYRDKGVRLQQDDYPAIEATWQQPPEAPLQSSPQPR